MQVVVSGTEHLKDICGEGIILQILSQDLLDNPYKH